MNRNRFVLVGLAALCCLGTVACTVTARVPAPRLEADVVVARPPPAPRIEEVPPPPGAHPELFVWQPGHWHWNGRDYEWHPGHYERRPARTAVWVPPEWVARDGQWVFRPGHWSYR